MAGGLDITSCKYVYLKKKNPVFIFAIFQPKKSSVPYVVVLKVFFIGHYVN